MPPLSSPLPSRFLSPPFDFEKYWGETTTLVLSPLFSSSPPGNIHVILRPRRIAPLKSNPSPLPYTFRIPRGWTRTRSFPVFLARVNDWLVDIWPGAGYSWNVYTPLRSTITWWVPGITIRVVYSSTLIKMAWSLEQDLTRQRANRRAEEEEEEEFRLRLEQIAMDWQTRNVFLRFSSSNTYSMDRRCVMDQKSLQKRELINERKEKYSVSLMGWNQMNLFPWNKVDKFVFFRVNSQFTVSGLVKFLEKLRCKLNCNLPCFRCPVK